MDQSQPEERRLAPRYSFNAKAVIRTQEGEEVAPVTILGLGIRGCRIFIEQRLTVGDEFELAIQPQGEEIRTNVVAVYWHKSGYAGLHFTTMPDEARKRLEQLVEYIAKTYGEPEVSSPGR